MKLPTSHCTNPALTQTEIKRNSCALTRIPKALDFGYVQTITAHAHFDCGVEGGWGGERKTKRTHTTHDAIT